MQSTSPRLSRSVTAAACLGLAGSVLAALPASAANDVVDPTSRLFVDWQSSTLEQAGDLQGQALDDAVLLASFPSASWITSGTPAEAGAEADRIATAAAAEGAVPTIVVYDLPFRDCAQYSAGGAADTAEYTAWVDAVAAGIGDRDAIVVLEPDGLGIIPWYTPAGASAPEWCQPAELDAATAAADRFTQLNHAVDALTALPSTAVYLDGTHTGWLGVGDITDRLIKAGVERADGFFLNVSNYEETPKLEYYAGWVSDCLALSTSTAPSASWWEPGFCASQYYPATPGDISTWPLTDAAYDKAFADTGLVRDRAAQKHAVLDTSRNGRGPWTAPAGKYTDPEVWCNPPQRGLGRTPTTATTNPVIDAYLWIKVPGESDGQCYRGTGGPLDPERGMLDPAAGQWFPEQAAELIALAEPPIDRPTCEVRQRVQTWPGGYRTSLRVRNTGTGTVQDWDLRFALSADQTVTRSWGADLSRTGSVLTASSATPKRDLRPGRTASFGFLGTGAPQSESLLFLLDGKPCSVR
jgi:endoglucanase